MWDAIKSAVGALASGLKQLGNFLNELINRILDSPGFIASLLGWKWPKKLRLRVIILRDEEGVSLLGQGSSDDVVPSPVPYISPEEEAKRAVDLANEIFKRECNVRLVGEDPIVRVTRTPAPVAALEVGCNWGAWGDDFGGAGSYFRGLAAQMFAGLPIGYGSPVTAFVVRRVEGKAGCSLGPVTNYVTVEASAMRSSTPRTLAHEIAHACFLLHREATDNLMNPDLTGERLTRWQVAVIRNSPHVTSL